MNVQSCVLSNKDHIYNQYFHDYNDDYDISSRFANRPFGDNSMFILCAFIM